MAWEKGHRYYTRSFRAGRRIVRQYVGKGSVAAAEAEYDRQEREARALRKTQRENEKTCDRIIANYCKAVDAVVANVMMAVGYHEHKGQWRRKRETK